jgi:neutral amino acid transport system permease protein
VLRNALQMKFGTGNKSFARPAIVADRILGVQMLPEQQFTLFASIVIIGLVAAFLTYTKYGKAMRALADNLDLARVTGIDVDRAIVYVWILSGALVAIAGVLLTLVANNIMNINMGFYLVLPMFAAVILGGIGSPYGAMVGGFVVGIAMKTSAIWIGSRYELAAALIILIVMLLFRPQGLLGGKV